MSSRQARIDAEREFDGLQQWIGDKGAMEPARSSPRVFGEDLGSDLGALHIRRRVCRFVQVAVMLPPPDQGGIDKINLFTGGNSQPEVAVVCIPQRAVQ